MKKQLLFVTILLLATMQMGYAQDSRHEFSLMLGGGLSGLKYSVDGGKNTMGFGIQGGLGYTFSINSSFGIVTGIEYGLYNSTGTLDDKTISTQETDNDRTSVAFPNGEPFTYNVKTTGYEEKQSVGMLSIPIMGQYRRELTNDMQLYAQAGMKLGFPLSATNSATAQELAITGHYALSNIDLPNPGEQYHGLGIYENWESGDQDLELNMSFSLSLEAGVNYLLSADWKIYGGLYVDYGLNSMLKNKTDAKTLVPYDPAHTGAPDVNTIMNMQSTGNAKILSFGLRVRIAFAPSGGGSGYRRR